MDKSDGSGRLQGRPLAVDFIDEHLSQHDLVFGNATSGFDNASGRYLPILPAQSNQSIASQYTMTNSALGPQSSSSQDAAPDQASQHVEAQSIKFWNDIFSEAKQMFLTDTDEPTFLARSGAGIRNARSWQEVCARLEEAQVAYTEGEGTTGMLKRMRRKGAENLSQPAANIVKMVPDVDPWMTPVAGTIGLLLRAMETAARTREEVLMNLSELDKTFSNIGSLATTFATDQNVRQASVSLIVAIFQAVEHAIAFFTKSAGRRAAAAIFRGSEYQKELRNGFNEIQKRSDYLLQKAQNCHFESTRIRDEQILIGQAQHSAEMKNGIMRMIEAYKRERDLDRKAYEEELKRREEIQRERDAAHTRRHQGNVQLNTTARLIRFANTISAAEILTLMHHQLQMTSRPVSPLPATLALPSPLSSTTHTAVIPIYPTWSAQTLLHLLGIPDISISDLQRVKQLGSTLSQSDKRKGDQIPQRELFRQWMGSLKPSKLLIHGSFRGSRAISPLSLLTATLTEALRADQVSFVSLVFFCGCHIDQDENTTSGGIVLIKVLISQLLQQRAHMNISPSPWELNPDRISEGDLHQLCQLFKILVHHLPREITLFCLIDGMVYYEREEFIDEMQYVLAEILGLVVDPTVQANVKILITSPWRTETTHRFFHEDLEILHMEGMPSVQLTPSASRVIRRHVSHMESDQSSRENSPAALE